MLLLRNRTLLAVSFAVCATYTGIGMVVPVRTLYAESRGASLFIIGAMASSYLISNFLFQGLYSAFGMFGGFVGATVSSLLYAVNFRLPLLAFGAVFGVGILVGGTLIRISEARDATRRGTEKQDVEIVMQETPIIA